MKRLTVAILVLSVLGLGGCVFVRPKAGTVLTLQPAADGAQSVSLGFRDTVWAKVNDDLTIIGHGSHPREHETYAFLLNEGYPKFQPRWMLIAPDADSEDYTVALWCWADPLGGRSEAEGVWFTGTISLDPPKAARQVKVTLDEVVLTSTDGQVQISVSGTILAEPKTQEYVQDKIRARARDTQSPPQPHDQ